MRIPAILAAVVILTLAGAAIVFWSMGRPNFWEFQISRYEKEDRIRPPKPGCVVFIGSSSIRFWGSLSDDMKPLDAINRGFGGSQISQVNGYASRIVIPYRPRIVVLYAGENDLSWPWSKSPETVLADFQQFVGIIHSALPGTWIYFISMKPDPLRRRNWPTVVRANKMIADFIRRQDHVRFIDVSAAMLDAQGQPRRELFRRDGLHMSAEGYALWTSIIRPVLLARWASLVESERAEGSLPNPQ